MAIIWTRETPTDTATAVLTWTGVQTYNFFASLIRDNTHTAFTDAKPYAGWYTDTFNAAIQLITGHTPSWRELLYGTTTADQGTYLLPDYVRSFRDVLWVKYGTATKPLPKIDSRTAIQSLQTGVTFSSYDNSGGVSAWEEDGDRGIRLLPEPSAGGTLYVMAHVMPPAMTTASVNTHAIPLPAHLKMAPAYWLASTAATSMGNIDLSNKYEQTFWRLVKTKIDDDRPSIEPLAIESPSYQFNTPNFAATEDSM